MKLWRNSSKASDFRRPFGVKIASSQLKLAGLALSPMVEPWNFENLVLQVSTYRR